MEGRICSTHQWSRSMVYARDTSISINRTREEIIATLQRYGADAFGYGSDGQYQLVYFRMHGRRIRLLVQLPDSEEFALTPTGLQRKDENKRRMHEQACRQRWRALASDQSEVGGGGVRNYYRRGRILRPHIPAGWANSGRILATADRGIIPDWSDASYVTDATTG